MNNAVATQTTTLKHMLCGEQMQQQFKAALPRHLSTERFVRVAITALSRTPLLQECTPESFFKCLLDLSAAGLEPDGRRAHLIPFRNNKAGTVECTLIIDYKGLVELVRRSGDVQRIHADVVCENDTFRHSLGEVVEHTYDLRKDRGKAYAAYAQVEFKAGGMQAAILSRSDIEAIRKRSKAGSSGPWVTDWNEMAKKTAFRNLSKWLTLSPEVMDAIASAESTEFAAVSTQPVIETAQRVEFAQPQQQAEPESDEHEATAFDVIKSMAMQMKPGDSETAEKIIAEQGLAMQAGTITAAQMKEIGKLVDAAMEAK